MAERSTGSPMPVGGPEVGFWRCGVNTHILQQAKKDLVSVRLARVNGELLRRAAGGRLPASENPNELLALIDRADVALDALEAWLSDWLLEHGVSPDGPN